MLTEQLHKILDLIKNLVENFKSRDEAFALCKKELAALRKADTQQRASNKQLEAEVKVLEEEQAEALKLIDDITQYLQKH